MGRFGPGLLALVGASCLAWSGSGIADPSIRIQPQSLDFVQASPDAAALAAVDFEASIQEATEAALTALLATAKQQGEVRVIVGFDLPFVPEGRLDALARQQQRQAIRSRGDQVLSQLRGTNHRANRQFRSIPFLALTVGEEALRRLASSPLVTSIGEDRLSEPTMASSNNVIGSPLAWAEGYDGAGQAVVILDTGVDKTHPWFTAGGDTVVSEACYSTASQQTTSLCPGGAASSTATDSGLNCSIAINGCDHGTHVAGTVAGNNGVGPGYGVARGANLIAMQVFTQFNNPGTCGGVAPCVLSYSSDQVSALERTLELAETFDIASVNMSLGGGQYFDQASCDAANASVKAAIDNLRSVDIATVIASGNNGWRNSIASPGCISSAISVGATTDEDAVASFSNVYPQLHLLAPGVSIESSVPGGGTADFNGTSMATPHVAGAWAVLKQANPSATVDQILAKLQANATRVDDLRTGGIEVDLPRINLDLSIDERTTFGVFNDGLGSLSITSIVPETPAPWITVVPAGPFQVPAGGLQVVEVQVDYAQAPVGDSQVRLLVSSNDPANSPWPGGVFVNVTRLEPIGPRYSSVPAPDGVLAFGEQVVDLESAAKTVAVTNTGDQELSLSCDLVGPDPGHFALAPCPPSLTPAGMANIEVRCAPTSIGVKSATLAVSSNDPGAPTASYSLTCTGIEAPIEEKIFGDGFE